MARVLCLLVVFACVTVAACAENSVGFRAELSHVDAGKGYSHVERLLRSAARSHSRAASLTRGGGFGPATIYPSALEFIFDLTVGNPPVNITALLDTGSNLFWIQCQPLIRSVEPFPSYSPFRSSTFAALPCNHSVCRTLADDNHQAACIPGGCFFEQYYDDDTGAVGYMGTDTFTIGTGAKRASFLGVAFGCGLFNAGGLSNASGIVGFGRQSISLVSQIGATAFSYCLPYFLADDAARGVLLVGSRATITGPAVRTTPIIPVDNLYYLSLQGITVGNTLLAIPNQVFRVGKDGKGGFIIDSGAAFTHLLTPAYKPLAEAFRKGIKLPAKSPSTLFELCYEGTMEVLAAAVPRLVFHFEGADWEIPGRNIVGEVAHGVSCVLVRGWEGDLSIMGNLMTMDTQVLYDIKRMMLSFAPARCNQL